MTTRYRRTADLVELTTELQSSKTGLSIEQIADHFEVSRRTAERMLSALRETFVQIEATSRGGRKYWRMPATSNSSSSTLPPVEVRQLSERIERLTSEVAAERESASLNNLIVDTVLGNSPVGIFVLDAEHSLVWSNGALLEFFGEHITTLDGPDARRLIQDNLTDTMEDGEEVGKQVVEVLDTNEPLEHFDCTVKAAPGRERRELRHWSTPIHSGTFAGGRVGLFVERPTPKSQGETRSLPEALGRVVASRVVNDPGSGSMEEVMHSIRSSLGGLLLIAEGARAGLIDPSQAMEKVHRQAQRIEAVVTDTSRFYRDRQLVLVPVVVSELVHEAVDEARWLADSRNVVLKIDGTVPSHTLVADRSLLLLAFAGLIRNAVEVNGHGGTVRVRAERDAATQSSRFSISDMGPGISDEIPSTAAGRASGTRSVGTGLGLTVVKDIIEGHGGTLTLEHSVSGGAIARIELPERQEL